ncbi:MAG: calcium/sodium antiporter [Clostridia bacterium]|nr:calcium/sodium antiporter [Clostridia bacterium]
MILQIIFMIIGFILLVKGADFLVEGGSNIAKKFHIPELIIGLTIVSIGTSMPELMVSLTSSLNGHSDLSIGNSIGSNISNLLLILGVCAIIKNLKFKKETKYFESPFALIVTILLFILANNHINGQSNIINRTEGVILLVVCLAFIIYNIIMSKKGEEFDGINKDLVIVDININSKRYMIKSISFIILGIVLLKFGGDFVVDSATNLAKILGMSEKMVSLTIVSIATSLPELVTSIVATKKGEIDIAIGNIIGSCIFNILLIIGVSACISPITYSVSYNKDFIILILATLLLCIFPFIGKKDEMTRLNGIIFLATYIIYMINLCLTAI